MALNKESYQKTILPFILLTCTLADYIQIYKLYSMCIISQALVAHSYNPSYLGGRDLEDYSSKPAWANSSRDPF
jgi:hypothetical protein